MQNKWTTPTPLLSYFICPLQYWLWTIPKNILLIKSSTQVAASFIPCLAYFNIYIISVLYSNFKPIYHHDFQYSLHVWSGHHRCCSWPQLIRQPCHRRWPSNIALHLHSRFEEPRISDRDFTLQQLALATQKRVIMGTLQSRVNHSWPHSDDS